MSNNDYTPSIGATVSNSWNLKKMQEFSAHLDASKSYDPKIVSFDGGRTWFVSGERAEVSGLTPSGEQST